MKRSSPDRTFRDVQNTRDLDRRAEFDFAQDERHPLIVREGIESRDQAIRELLSRRELRRIGRADRRRVTEAIEDLIIKRASVPLIRAQARAEGMRTLRDAGLRKVALGETSVAEVLEHTIADAEEPAPVSMETPHHA